MEKTDVIGIQSLIGTRCSDDGSHVLLRTKTNAGELTLAIPLTHINALIGSLASEAGNAREISHQNSGILEVFDANRFEMSEAEDQMVLSFEMAKNQQISFRLAKGMEHNLLEVMCSSLSGNSHCNQIQ